MYKMVELGTLITQAKTVRCGDNAYPVLSMTMHEGLVFQGDKFKKVIASKDTSEYKVVYRNQLVISFPIDEGVLAAQRIADVGIVSPAYGIWDIDQKRILPEFLEYALRCERAIDYYKAKLRGSTARRRSLPTPTLLAFSVPLPNLEEQIKILDIIHKAKTVIDCRKQEIAKLDELIKARFVELFGDININDKNWECQPLGELCTIVRGGSPRPIDKFLGGDVPWIKIGDATDGDNIYLNSTKEYIIQEGVKKSRLVKSGSLIFANCGVSLGFARIITFDGCIHDGWLAMEDIDERLNKVFLLQALNQMTQHFREIAPAGTQPNLNTAIMKAYMQIIPPMEMQKEFIAFVDQVDKSKFIHNDKELFMSEFGFISQNIEYEKIYSICCMAEAATEAGTKAKLCREALDEIIKFLYQKENKKYPENATMLELIDSVFISGLVNNSIILKSLHYVRKLGMNAIHGIAIKKKKAKLAFDNIVFFVRFIVKKYEDPSNVHILVPPPYMSEAETRKIYIDQYLSEAGWEVMEPNSETILPNGTKVASGTVFPGKACSEIPVKGMQNVSGIGFCDYVLYGKDGKPLAIVEAKKTSVQALVGQQQVKEYGNCIKAVCGYVPVLYYTNGYEIYVVDGVYPARKIMAFHSMGELEYMLQKRNRNDITDFKINDSISGRPYQKMAITKVCECFNDKFRRSLIVMATGTGKTRVSISLVDVLLRNKWIKNVLFLADRTSLVSQAFVNFSKILPDMSYCVLSDRSLANEPNARVTFSTHQTMINYIDSEQKEYTCGRFDLIIIDEAHRSIFNKYGAIFDYFDALLVGLTATPKDEVDASTYQLFNCENGEPNYAYSLQEAVKEKYLVPYKVESKTTKLLSQGIKYGDLSDEDKKRVDSVLMQDDVENDFVIPKEKLFKLFYNIDTCGRVLDDLMNNGLRVDYGQKIGKTIIFAYNHRHADLIVKVFKENYPTYGDDYCQLIDNKVKGADKLIAKFEEDDNFRIAVSVDMLDTGIDVPSVMNLVFFKPVRSKIKFVQMIGRGTRLCLGLVDGKDKEFFLIFDYCGNFEFFEENPNGVSITNGKSLSQKLYDVRLDILVELQSYDHQANPIHKAYYDKLKDLLYKKTTDIKEKNSSRISVRQEMSYVDKYVDYEKWSAIPPLSKKEIQLHLSKLVDNDLEEDKGALRFDMQMLQIELAVLANGSAGQAAKQVERVRLISKLLLNYAAGKPAVMDKAESLKAIVSTEFWSNPGVDRLEKYREDIRNLLIYLPPGSEPVDVNTEDEVMEGGYTGNTLLDIRTYKERVIDYLAEHTDNATIKKIQNLDPINADDLKELERILWSELGTKEDYRESTDIDNLAAFIRSIVGVQQEAINEKFGEFLNDNITNSDQQEFVKSIIDYVRENGDIKMEDLIEKSPFDNYDILSLFGSNIIMVKTIVERFHNSIQAAA